MQKFPFKLHLFILVSLIALLLVGQPAPIDAQTATVLDAQVSASADDAYQDPDSWPGYSHADTNNGIYAGNPGSSGNAVVGGFRWTNLGIPDNATITVAYVHLNQTGWGYSIPTILSFENSASPATFSSASGPSARWASHTTFQLNWTWPKGNPGDWIQTPDLSVGIQELVNTHGGISEIVLLEDGTGVAAGQYHNWQGYDNNTLLAAKLHIEYTAGPDETPPVRSNGNPTGNLPSGATEITLSLDTNENAACKYDTTAGIAYASMANTFAATGGTSHSTSVGGLSDGNSYDFYVKCQDEAGNANTDDYLISFTVNLDTEAPARSNGQPTGTLLAGTTETTLSVDTNENAACKYDTTAGIAYASMANTFAATGGTSHSTLVSGLEDGNTYEYYVRCQDEAGNANADDYLISFSVSSPGPAILDAQVSASADDAYHDPDSWPGYSHSDASSGVYAGNPGSSGAATVGGFRWTNLNIPAGAVVTEAYVELNQKGWGYQIPTTLSFENAASSTAFSSTSGPADRWASRTTFQLNWTWPKKNPGHWIQTPDLSAGIQELVNTHGGISELVLLEDGTGVAAGQYHNWQGYDSNTLLAAKLHVEYTAGSPPPPGNNPPDDPVLLSPANGAVGAATSAPLKASVSHPDGDTMDVAFWGREKLDPFRIVVLPDTQKYSESFPEIFTAQTQWIADNAEAMNIQFVIHEGDIVQAWDSTAQWDNAHAAMSILDTAGVPYSMLPGNWDHENNSTTGSTQYYNQYFGPTRFSSYPWYGGNYNENDNNYQLLTINKEDYVFVSLDWCPSADEIDWVNTVLTEHAARKAMLTTHGYLNDAGEITNINGCGDGTYIWENLIKQHDNLQIVLNGHEIGGDGEAYRVDPNLAGNPVHQMLANSQEYPNGGNGWLRILEFMPAENKVQVRTYSPYLNQEDLDPSGNFSFAYDLNGSFANIGTVLGAVSGSTAEAQWANLAEATTYEWYAEATDPDGQSAASDAWSFTTQGEGLVFLGNWDGSAARYSNVWGEGNFAYIGHHYEAAGMDIIDVSDPANPVKVGNFGNGFTTVWSIRVRNGIAFLSSRISNNGVYIVDVTNPASPVLLSQITSADGGHDDPYGADLEGNYLYVPNNAGTDVHVFDISDPANPVKVRTIAAPGFAVHDVFAQNGKLYTFGWTHTGIFDVSNVTVAAPLLGTITAGSHSGHISDNDRYLAIGHEALNCGGGEKGVVTIWDVLDPANPVLVSTLDPAALGFGTNSSHYPFFAGNLLYVSWLGAGLKVFDVADIANPALVGEFDTTVGYDAGCVDDGNWGVYPLLGPGRILASDWQNGLSILDASGLATQ